MVSYLVTGNIGEVLVVAAVLTLLPELAVPLLPVQLLWVNLVTDGLPALALGLDQPPGDPMRPTARARHGLLDLRILSALASRSLVVAGIVVITGLVGRARGWEPGVVRTQILLALLAVHLLLACTVRSRRATFEPGWWRNRVLNGAIAGSLLIQVLAFATPAGRDVLRLSPLPIEAWAIAVLAAAVTVAAIDGLRTFRSKPGRHRRRTRWRRVARRGGIRHLPAPYVSCCRRKRDLGLFPSSADRVWMEA